MLSLTHPHPPSQLYSTNAPSTTSREDSSAQSALEEGVLTTLTAGFSRFAPSDCKCCIKESTLSLFAAAILFSTAFLTLTPVMSSRCPSDPHGIDQIIGSLGTFFSLALLSRAIHARYRCGSSQEATPFLGSSTIVDKWGITYTIIHRKGAEKRYVFGYAFLALVNASCLIAASILCAHQT